MRPVFSHTRRVVGVMRKPAHRSCEVSETAGRAFGRVRVGSDIVPLRWNEPRVTASDHGAMTDKKCSWASLWLLVLTFGVARYRAFSDIEIRIEAENS